MFRVVFSLSVKPKRGAFAELIGNMKTISIVVVLMGIIAGMVYGIIHLLSGSGSQTETATAFSPVCEESGRYGTSARIKSVPTVSTTLLIDGQTINVAAGDWAELNRDLTEDRSGIDWNGSGSLQPDTETMGNIYFLDPARHTGADVDGAVIPAAPGTAVHTLLHGTGKDFKTGWKIYRNLTDRCWGIDTGQTFTVIEPLAARTLTRTPTWVNTKPRNIEGTHFAFSGTGQSASDRLTISAAANPPGGSPNFTIAVAQMFAGTDIATAQVTGVSPTYIAGQGPSVSFYAANADLSIRVRRRNWAAAQVQNGFEADLTVTATAAGETATRTLYLRFENL